jgi:hypothetical protein
MTPMTPHKIVALAYALRRYLPEPEQARVQILVTRKEWDDLCEVIMHLRPITKHPQTKAEPPSLIYLLGIQVVVAEIRDDPT